MSALPERLTGSVLIDAERATVFRFFTDSALFAAWWGAGSMIDPRPGGRVLIRYPNAVIASGVVELCWWIGLRRGQAAARGTNHVAFCARGRIGVVGFSNP